MIPTAEEFLKKEELVTDINEQKAWLSNVKRYMIEFAKLHVEAALEAALEDSPHGSSTDIPSYEDMKDAILNAYPLTNIK